MTTEELIIGHFEGSLTSVEATELQEVLAASPDARSLFENHEALHSILRADAASLVPAAPLASDVLETALATPVESVGGAVVGRWGFGQIAAGFGTLVLLVGGTFVATRTANQPATPQVATPAPAVAPAFVLPQPTAPNPPQLVERETPKAERPVAASSATRSVEPRKTAPARTSRTEPTRVPIGGDKTQIDKGIKTAPATRNN